MQNIGWRQTVIMLNAANGMLYQHLHELKGANVEDFLRAFTYRATTFIALVWWIPVYTLSMIVAFIQVPGPILGYLIFLALIVVVLVLSILFTSLGIYHLYKQGYYEWEYRYNRR